MNTWIIAASSAEIGAIIDAAGADSKLLIVGDEDFANSLRTAPVSHIYWVKTASACESYAGAVAEWLNTQDAHTILAADLAPERTLATAIAAKLQATWISGAISWNRDTNQIVRSVAALSEETLAVNGKVAMVLPSGEIPTGSNPEFTEVNLSDIYDVEILATTASSSATTDLSRAERVIGVGRGIAQQPDLAMVEDLAQVLNAQIGATRPLAEGSGWFDSYIGLTGQVIAPKLYLAIGISGQIHHTGGVRGADIIVAINEDPQAPIFADADYAIVGDLYEIVPALKDAL